MRRRAWNWLPTEASATAITLKVKPHLWGSQPNDNMWAGYRITFIGKGGTVLQEVEGTEATYTVKGSEGYVRARVTAVGRQGRLDAARDARHAALAASEHLGLRAEEVQAESLTLGGAQRIHVAEQAERKTTPRSTPANCR